MIAELRDDSGTGTRATGWYNACITEKGIEERTLAAAGASASRDTLDKVSVLFTGKYTAEVKLCFFVISGIRYDRVLIRIQCY